ncbi:cell division protein FtsW [Paenibacillus sp. J45TS6]|uniref:FtsW/RodA/SpoVE family cell cycle protein n=1 Tax=unclassified Paenibacillus TaxID=185978 RepID=UPI001B047F5C|nr:FtsW/RodA/SpoVE family cell cycle protein [Paenibacillus sp. J45TS6]GIP42866.1 cell division protein FtsW [Paenibacillus sp. J45TS6]
MLQKLKKIDSTIIWILCFFMLASILLIHSGIQYSPEKFAGSEMKMVIYYLLSFAALLVTALFHYKLILKYYWYIYGAGILLLVYVSFFGKVINGSRGWISIPHLFNVQPAEVFKIILIITLGGILMKQNKKLTFWRNIIPLSLVTLLPFALVMKTNDMGNALSYLVILIGMLWIGDIKNRHALIILLLIAVLSVGGIKSYITFHDQITTYLSNTEKGHWLDRIDPWLLPEEAGKDASYHTRNAKIAIASGGLLGKGYMQGTMVQTGYVPYTYSDSIIVVAAEEFGFLGVSLLLFLYFILIYRLIYIALECKNKAGPILIVGIVAMFIYQIFENVGMFIGLMPLTGITLPFLSFGGSSLLINMLCIGVVLSIKVNDEVIDDMLPSTESLQLNKRTVL